MLSEPLQHGVVSLALARSSREIFSPGQRSDLPRELAMRKEKARASGLRKDKDRARGKHTMVATLTIAPSLAAAQPPQRVGARASRAGAAARATEDDRAGTATSGEKSRDFSYNPEKGQGATAISTGARFRRRETDANDVLPFLLRSQSSPRLEVGRCWRLWEFTASPDFWRGARTTSRR